MIQKMNPLIIHPRLGQLTQADERLMGNSGYVKEQINMQSDVIGRTTVRDGITQLGGQIVNNYSVSALYNFRDSGAGTDNQLIAVVGDGTYNDIWYLNGSTWTKTLEDKTKDKKYRFATFSDRVIAVNSSENMVAWDGDGAWDTTGDPLNVQSMASTTVGTCTMTQADPCVVTLNSHGLATGDVVLFTTSGALLTGLSVNTLYYVIYIGVNTFNLATSYANSDAGTKIATTGTQSGTHTLTKTPYDCAYIETMMARVFVANTELLPDRLFFSSASDVSGNITWTPSTDYIDINPNDGSNITALKRFGTKLLVFKSNYLYRVEGTGLSSTTDPDPLIGIGTQSQESVVEGKGGIYYHNPRGFFVYKGGYPEDISKPIQDWADAITVANYSEIIGWADRDHVYWSVGDVTVGGTAFTNIVLVYTISSNTWFIYSYPNQITAAASYYGKSTTEVWEQVVGDDDGNVYTFNSGDTDDGTSIKYSLTTHFYDFGVLAHEKNITKLLVASNELVEARIAWQTREMNKDEWKDIGQLQEKAQHLKDLNIKGEEIRFKIFGSRTDDGGYFRYIEVLDLISEGVIK